MLNSSYVPTPVEERMNIIKTGKTGPFGSPEYVRLSLSPSKMITYDECKAKFRSAMLKLVKDPGNIYTCIGTAAHYVVEQINKGTKLDRAEREELLRMKLFEECAKHDVAVNFTSGYKEARDTLLTYEVPRGWNFVQGETLQQLEFPLYTFRYIIDALFVSDDGKTLYIVDFKTNAQPPKNPLQLLLYAWATSVWNPQVLDYDIRPAYYMLRKDQIVYHEVTREKVESIQAYMDNSVALMAKLFEAEYFPTTPENGGCHFCPLVDCADRDGSRDRGN